MELVAAGGRLQLDALKSLDAALSKRNAARLYSMDGYLRSAYLLALVAVSFQQLLFKWLSFVDFTTRSRSADNNTRISHEQKIQTRRWFVCGQTIACPRQGARPELSGSILMTRETRYPDKFGRTARLYRGIQTSHFLKGIVRTMASKRRQRAGT
jgi:hypothetical protein